MRTLAVIFSLLFISGRVAYGQMTPSCSIAQLQLGANYTIATPDYTTQNAHGYGFYAALDTSRNYGVTSEFHEIYISKNSSMRELSYEAGIRYFKDYYRRFRPFGQLSTGYGRLDLTSNLVQQVQQTSSLIVSGSAGIDVTLRHHLSARAEVEYAHWMANLQIHNGLTPVLYSFGFAYRIPLDEPK